MSKRRIEPIGAADESGLAPEVDEAAADAFEDEVDALTKTSRLAMRFRQAPQRHWEMSKTSSQRPIEAVEDSDEAIEVVDIQEDIEPIGEARSRRQRLMRLPPTP